MKIILNKCFGGFGISSKAYKLYSEKKRIKLYPYIEDNSNYISKREIIFNKADWNFEALDKELLVHYFTKDLGDSIIENSENETEFNKLYSKYNLYIDTEYRTDPILIEVVEELKADANNRFSNLCVVEIPDNLNYVIDDYDGKETLHEYVKTW